ncbi:MAG: hypothetical protein QGG17_02990 [Rhodospirillales bacterium]|nr:hypothetical protein [Rhodospirillales bacterium]
MSAPEPIAWREVASLAPSAKPTRPADARTVAQNSTSGTADASFAFFGDVGFSFFDLVDIINPLQHIPIVSSIYRHFTGDELDAAPRVLGGALFGGAIGAAAALVNVIVDEATGNDIGGHAVAFFVDEMADDTVVAAVPEEAGFETAAGAAGELPWRKDKALGDAMPWLAADNAAAVAPADADSETAELAWHSDQVLGDAMPWLAADDAGGESAGGASEERTGPWAIQALADAGAIPGTAAMRDPQSTPAGAVAAEGGWFADVMLAALHSYERGAALSGAPQAPIGGITR